MTASLEIAVDALTTQTTALLDTCTTLRDSTGTLISDAVAVSENASQIPLVSMGTSIISTQATFINYINGTV
jgi:hypothetical protein